MAKPSQATVLTVAGVLAFAIVLWLQVSHYLPFIADDALISLRYANRLLHGHGLTWTDGQRVEGYSNLLWVLVVSVPGLFGADLVQTSRIAGFAGMVTVLAAVAGWTLRRGPARLTWFPAVLALTFLTFAAPIAVWAIGGLEQPLYAALLAISIVQTFGVVERGVVEPRALIRLSLTLGLLCLTRPDGPLFTAAAMITIAMVARISKSGVLRTALSVLIFPVGFTGGQLLFRIFYYGALVPNTALVKLAFSWARAADGLRYVEDGLKAIMPMSAVAAAATLALLVSGRERMKGVHLTITAAAWTIYVVVIGGDIFPAYRHLIPVIVMMAFALAEGAVMMSAGLSRHPIWQSGAAAAILLCLVPYARHQADDKQSRRAVRERWEWQGKELGLVLKNAFAREQPLLAVTAAGALPYWSELPALDMLGLNDWYIARHPPPHSNSGFPGHDLGDGRYVFGRLPDLIIFSIGSPPAFRSGDDLNAMPEFHARYVPVIVKTPSYSETPIVYVDRYSAKIGITASESSITIPGFLLTGPHTIAEPLSTGMLGARVPPGESADLRFGASATADWTVAQVQTEGPWRPVSEIRRQGAQWLLTVRASGTDSVTVEQVILSRSARARPGA